MQRRTFLALALSVVGGTWLVGCGGGSSSTAARGTGAVEGFAFLRPDGSIVLFPTAEAGVGLTPAAGVHAQIVGSSVGGTVGGNGSLTLSGIEAGLRVLRLTPGSGAASTDIPLTVVPDAVLPLGETPINRQQAVDALQAVLSSLGASDLFTTADVLATSTPLPAGVVLTPALPAGEDPLTIENPSWLVYVDRAPGARFGHRTLIVLVDAVSGEVKGIDSLSWPTLNGASFYAESTINATSQDAVMTASRRVPHRTAQAPSPLKSLQDTGTIAARSATCRAKDPDESRTHVLMVQGATRDDFGADMDTVEPLLSGAPFPRLATLRKIKTFESSGSARDVFLREFATVRDACKSGDTFVLYVTSHGMIDKYYPEPTGGGRDTHGLVFKPAPPPIPLTPEEIAASYRLVLQTGNNAGVAMYSDGKAYKADLIEPGALDFSGCKACRIVVWIDTCYSGNWIPLLSPRLDALPHRDILILTSSDTDTVAQGVTRPPVMVTVEGETVNFPLGGAFTQAVLLGANRPTAAETGPDALLDAFAFASAATAALGRDLGKSVQHPDNYRRPLEEGDVCGRGIQDVTIK